MTLEKFQIIVLPLREKLLGYSRKWPEAGADAEDIVQEVLLRLWERRDSLDGYRNLEALAVQMVKNRCIDRWRMQKKLDVPCLTGAEAAPDNPELLLERKDAADRVKALIERLPPLQQAIIRMKDVEGYELDEIAAITGTQAEAVRMNLSRARKKVREGIYKNGTSQERRYRNSLTIPLPGWTRRKYDPHWAGFGIGFANLGGGSLRPNSVCGLDLRSGKSFQFNPNLFDYALTVSRRGWGVVSGPGFRWDVYP